MLNPLIYILVFFIKIYQYGISPLMGPSKCRYTPTCSAYTIEALKKYGLLKGTKLALKRIASCRPGGGHGFNPVP